MSKPLTPLPCPFCGMPPSVEPVDPETEGAAFGIVKCRNARCPAQPLVVDGEPIADERGSQAYKDAAIRRWNAHREQKAGMVVIAGEGDERYLRRLGRVIEHYGLPIRVWVVEKD